MSMNREVTFVFLDIEKAYDTVKRNEIWECIRKRGITASLTKKIKILYKDTKSSVQIGQGNSQYFNTKTGSNKEVHCLHYYLLY